jgi:hypothetical protein
MERRVLDFEKISDAKRPNGEKLYKFCNGGFEKKELRTSEKMGF